MPQTSFALLTALGRAKEAASIASSVPIEITHIALGDGETVPAGAETELYNEVARKVVSGSGTVVGAENTAYFDCFLAAMDGPFTIREAGLIDSDGDLIAIAHYNPPIHKPVPASGQTVEGTIRLEVAFSDVANITIVVDPTLKVPLQKLTVLPFVPVLSTSVAVPPVAPNLGDTYVIAAGATGAWAGHAGKIAERTSAGWAIIDPPDGHGVGHNGLVYMREAGTYRPLYWIMSNLTLTIGSQPTDDFASIPAALNWLRYRMIANDATVTLSLRAEVHVYNGTRIIIDHPTGRRIRIVGPALNGADPTINDFAVTGSSSADRTADRTTNQALLSGKFKAEIRLLNGATIEVRGDGLGLLDDVLISSDGTSGDGLGVYNSYAEIGTVAILGTGSQCVSVATARLAVRSVLVCCGASQTGIRVRNGHVVAAGNISDMAIISLGHAGHGLEAWSNAGLELGALHCRGNNSHGAVVYRGSNLGTGLVSTFERNGAIGLQCTVSGSANIAGGSSANNNGQQGISCVGGHAVLGAGSAANNNVGNGIFASQGGVIEASSPTFNNNGAWGVQANRGGLVAIIGTPTVTGNASGTYTPAANTVGNNNAYIFSS